MKWTREEYIELMTFGNIDRPMFAELFGPLVGLVSSCGTRLFSQDSDGNMNAVVDVFLECGVNIMYPFEPAAGMDMVETRKKYGNALAVKGGIDKHVLRRSKEDIRRELEYKLQPFMHKETVFGSLQLYLTVLLWKTINITLILPARCWGFPRGT